MSMYRKPQIDWAEFVTYEMFDSYQVDSGSKDGRTYTELLLFAGSKIFRFNVHDLLPELEGSARDCPFEMLRPMCVMRGSDVKRLSRNMTHREAREAGLLLELEFVTETLSESMNLGLGGALEKSKYVTLPLVGSRVLNPLRRIFYIAHRWQAPNLQDPAQMPLLQTVQSAVHDADFVWMDFFSVPSSPGEPGKEAAIRSMQAYVFRASCVLVCATSNADLERLFQRTWCQAELYAALCPVLKYRDNAMIGSGTGGDIRSVSKCIYKHSCDVEVLIHGRSAVPLELDNMANPLRCQITNSSDLEQLIAALERVRDALRDARPREEEELQELTFYGLDCGVEIKDGPGYGGAVEGIDDGVISTLLRALGNLKMPGQR